MSLPEKPAVAAHVSDNAENGLDVIQRRKLMDNPNAFPTANGGSGMSLRDYFAAQVLPHLHIAGPETAERKLKSIAEMAYRIADAMLAERTKEQSNG